MQFLAIFLGLTAVAYAVPGLKGACKTGNFSTVDIDPVKYSGAWFELGHSESFFWDFDCVCTTAEYTLLEDGSFRVLNSCRKKVATASLFQRTASAKIVAPGQLSVNFFAGIPLANSDYRIVWVDENYDRAIIVSCSWLGGSLIWLVTRSNAAGVGEFNYMKGIVEKLGFDTSDLVLSKQEGCWSVRGEKSIIRQEVKEYVNGVPPKCSLPSRISGMKVQSLEARWHILYTQPDFVENIFSKNCQCNTVTLESSNKIRDRNDKKYAGTFRATVTCRNGAIDGPRYDFVRPVYEISNLTSYLGHYTQKLYGGLAQEHWQIVAYGKRNNIVTDDRSDAVMEDNAIEENEHMLLYTCLDAGIFGKTFCTHIISRKKTVSPEVVEKYRAYAQELGIYDEKAWRPVVHGDGCLYDPVPVLSVQ